MWSRGWLVCLLAVVLTGCAVGKPARYSAERIAVPEHSQVYLAEARPDGVTGGPGAKELEAEVLALLAERGDKAEPDGALGATASWGLHEVNQGRTFDGVATDAASRHFGFGGVVMYSAAFGVSDREAWLKFLAAVPRNHPITRYGISVSPAGGSAALVLGNMELSYEPISRAPEPGQSVTMKGQVSSRHSKSQLFLTKPDGSIDQKDLPNRSFNETFALTEPGTYRLEVVGIGHDGATVVANLPLFVGVPEPSASNVKGSVVDPEQAEARLLVLLNRARMAAGVGALRADAELREIALSHTQDMVDNKFAAHVSPRTGAPEDRVKRAGLVVALFAENVALAGTPEQVHENLMASPGHRKNMLLPAFTHIGIAADKTDAGLTVTMNFARRPNSADMPKSTAEVEAAARALRKSHGLGGFALDPVLMAGAQAGAEALAAGSDAATAQKAMQKGMQREVDRLRRGGLSGCHHFMDLLEPAQLSTLPALLSPALKSVGIGTKVRQDSKGTRLSSVLMFDAGACK